MVAHGGASTAKRFVCWLKHVELTSSITNKYRNGVDWDRIKSL